ncbi:MAG: hypothetical protein K6D91_05985 [Prevotella sp.]|nr:hypothetical protein [Prevotella sp.]
MSTSKIENIYNPTPKQSGEAVDHGEWNELAKAAHDAQEKINEVIDIIPSGGSGSVVTAEVDPSDSTKTHIYINGKEAFELTVKSKGTNVAIVSNNNVNIEPRMALGTGEDKSGANMKGGNISLKPGDDIELCSHHRGTGKDDEVSVKVIDGEEKPVKLQLNASEITLTTKDKEGTDATVLDINVNSGKNERGYLKVRAKSVDVRCSDGGVALQPCGSDGQGNENKVKFEHGGGDGLEFGTFNTKKSSLFTEEYRFKKDGIWKMATRNKVASDKANLSDPTTSFKYEKQADDFYDIINPNDEQCTTNDIIKTANAFNNSKNRHAKYTEEVTSKGKLKKTLEIETVVTISYTPVTLQGSETIFNDDFDLPSDIADAEKVYSISDFKDAIKTIEVDGVLQKYGTAGDDGVTLSVGGIVMIGGSAYEITEHFAPSMDITSNAELSLKGKDKLKLGGGIVEFGSDSIDLGEMEDGLYAQYKLTKKNNSKACDVLKVKVINNQTTPLSFDSDSANFSVDSFYPGSDVEHPAAVTVPGKVETPETEEEATQHIQVVAQCKMIDVIKLAAWAKNNNFGPWSQE